MSISNFTLVNFQNGNILTSGDLNALASAIHTVLGELINSNNKTPLLPDTFTAENKIPAIINNSIFMIDGSGNVILVSRDNFDTQVLTATNAATSASASAASAASSYNAALALGSVLPAQSSKAGLELTTDGNQSAWGITVPGALSILNTVGFFQ